MCGEVPENSKIAEGLKEIKEIKATLENQSGITLSKILFNAVVPIILGFIGAWVSVHTGLIKIDFEREKFRSEMMINAFSEEPFVSFTAAKMFDSDEMETMRDMVQGGVFRMNFRKLKNSALSNDMDNARYIYEASKCFGDFPNNGFIDLCQNDPAPQVKDIAKYDKAFYHELEGFNYIIKGEFYQAKQSFDEAEKAYPTIHNAREISMLLGGENENGMTFKFDNPPEGDLAKEKKRFMLYIVDKLKWGVPENTLERLKESSK